MCGAARPVLLERGRVGRGRRHHGGPHARRARCGAGCSTIGLVGTNGAHCWASTSRSGSDPGGRTVDIWTVERVTRQVGAGPGSWVPQPSRRWRRQAVPPSIPATEPLRRSVSPPARRGRSTQSGLAGAPPGGRPASGRAGRRARDGEGQRRCASRASSSTSPARALSPPRTRAPSGVPTRQDAQRVLDHRSHELVGLVAPAARKPLLRPATGGRPRLDVPACRTCAR